MVVVESSAQTSADPIAMMEFYMKKAAQEERRRQPKQSKDEMPPPASLQGSGRSGLYVFLGTCLSLSLYNWHFGN